MTSKHPESLDKNTRNAFVVDLPEDDPDLQELNQLYKIKQQISKTKKRAKAKSFEANYPDIAELKRQLEREREERQLKHKITEAKNQKRAEARAAPKDPVREAPRQATATIQQKPAPTQPAPAPVPEAKKAYVPPKSTAWNPKNTSWLKM